MNRERSPHRPEGTAAEAWTGTRGPIDQAKALDPASYTDRERHAIELDRVFERAWVCVGLAAEATEPGTVLVRALGRRSILITVDEHGTRHGHLNTCRHRGTELVDADCTVRGTIRCPYHRWGYGLDGSLISTPRFDRASRPDIDLDQLGLVGVRIASAIGLLFATLDQDPMPLETWLGDLPRRLDGYDLASWVPADTLDIEIEANWKLISENFQEYYHLPWVHPDLATVSRVEDHYRYQGPGGYCGQTTTPVSDGDGSTWLSLPPKPGLDASDAVSGRHLAIFPNVLLSILPNHAFVMLLQPLGPGRTRETCTWLLPDPLDDDPDRLAGFAAIRQFWLEVNGEDIDIVQRSQRGLTTAAGLVAPGPLVPRFEEPLHRFHSILADHHQATRVSTVTVPAGDRPGADAALGGRANPNPPPVERAANEGGVAYDRGPTNQEDEEA